MQITLVLSLLALAIVLFARERMAADLVTLLLLVLLVATGVLTTGEAFEGFSSDIIIILASIFVIGSALQETRVLDSVGRRLVSLARRGPKRLLLILMGGAAGLSAFMSNTAVTSVLLPPVMSMGKEGGISPSRLLMPLAFASILGGTCTLIGTSTNVAVSGYMEKAGLRPLGFFEIAPMGLVIVGVGIAYMVLIGSRLLSAQKEGDPLVTYALRDYLSEIVVLPGSRLAGQSIASFEFAHPEIRVLGVLRGDEHFGPGSGIMINESDTLLVEAPVATLMTVSKREGVEMRGKLDLDKLRLGKADLMIVEVLVVAQSSLIGRTLNESGFSERFGLPVLAIHRQGQPLLDKVGDVPLLLGDLLLVEGPSTHVEKLRGTRGVMVLDEHHRAVRTTWKGIAVVGAFTSAILLGSLGLSPLSITLLGAAVLSILLGCITIERARSAIDLRLLLLIGGMTAFGTAMEKTGAAAMVAQWVVAWLSPLGPLMVLAGFFVLTIALTQPMSNAAAALVVLPVAMNAARTMGASERTFAIAIMLAASISFITPLEPSCTLVYGPGRYRFMDFVKVGGGLTLVLIPVVLLFIPIFWSL